MLEMRFAPVLGLVFVSLFSGHAVAQPLQTTKYTYYSVSGTTSSEINSSMLRSGPRVNGADAYAATTATTSQAGKFVQGDNCQVQNYQVRINFVIRLPRLSSDSSLSPDEQSRWQQFSTFVKLHEATHRAIWLGCFQELEDQIKAIKAKNCSSANATAAKLFDNMRAICSARHVAFDAAEQKRLLKNPFVRTVLRAQSRDVKAAAAH